MPQRHDAAMQAREYCQAMCLNHARVGRSLRARAGSWAHLHAYACTADSAMDQCRADQQLLSQGCEWRPQAGAQVCVPACCNVQTLVLQLEPCRLGLRQRVHVLLLPRRQFESLGDPCLAMQICVGEEHLFLLGVPCQRFQPSHINAVRGLTGSGASPQASSCC